MAQRVRVHFNLRTHLWSITAMEGERKGKVVEHVERFALSNCRFIVSEASRKRVLAQRQRSVHAWVEGYATELVPRPAEAQEFTYNPYRGSTFTLRHNGQAIHTAKYCWFEDRLAYAV